MDERVTAETLKESLEALGVKAGDLVLVHSSLSSFGYVEDGADTVIDAFLTLLTTDGTLVMPTLSQKNFESALEDWSMDRPSDVGLITETFRKRPGVLRSDQETHSVCAAGKLAYELTREHKGYGPRFGPYSEWAFSESSPWQKMYEHHAKVVFLGVDFEAHTFKHFSEYRLTAEVLDQLDAETRGAAVRELRYRLGAEKREGVWCYLRSAKLQETMEAAGLLRHAVCAKAKLLMLTDVHESVDLIERLARDDPEAWSNRAAAEWFERYRPSR